MKDDIKKLKEIYDKYIPEAFTLSHYELGRIVEESVTPEEWKHFLTDPEINDWIQTELRLMAQMKIQQLVNEMGGKNSSKMGLGAQLNALQKFIEAEATQEGTLFVYTFVPLSEEQQKAPAVDLNTTDDLFAVSQFEFNKEEDEDATVQDGG